MKQLSMFSGRLYNENENTEGVEECLRLVEDDITPKEIEIIQLECKNCEFHHEHEHIYE